MGAFERYRKRALVQVAFDFNSVLDADIIQWLEAQDNKSGAVKAVIRDAIRREDEPTPKTRNAGYIRLNLTLNRNTDADIIQWFSQQGNRRQAVRDAIRRNADETS